MESRELLPVFRSHKKSPVKSFQEFQLLPRGIFVCLMLLFLAAVNNGMGISIARADHLLPAHQLQCSTNFPCPPELGRRIDFWIEVFKGWDKSKAILHDPVAPERVYVVIDTGHGCSSKVKKRIRANRKAISTSLEALATNIAKGRKITNKRQRHLATLFPDRSPKNIRRAAKNIRCQSGVRDSFIAGLKRFNQYSDLVDRVLKENKLSPEIRYLPFVESSYNPAAYSKAGAAGLWQIMPSTARSLGLELNAALDERLDPEAATRAAAKYFVNATKTLRTASKAKRPDISNAEVNPFIITSYNYGVNGMRRAINRVSPDFMQVLNVYKSPNFRVAVKNFYASFLAARHVALNADRYFGSVRVITGVNTQTLILKHPTSIDRVKEVFGLSEKELKPLNRPLTRFIWNGWRLIPSGYKLALPPRQDNWKAQRQQLASLAPEKIIPGGKYYKVRRGDTACGIARALRVNCSTLIRVNNLGSRAIIRIGQKLIIPQKLVASSGDSAEKPPKLPTPRTSWTVRKGDTACGIARRNSVSCRELIQLNRLGRKARIYVGQKLRLPVGDYLASSATGMDDDNRYIVQKGDIACNIASRFRVNCGNLIKLNKLGRKARIYPGQKLRIPGYVAPKTTETAAKLASSEPVQIPNQAIRQTAASTTPTPNTTSASNPLINLLDTLPDLSIRVGSQNNQPVYFVYAEVDETLGHFADWLGIGGSAALRKLNKLENGRSLQLGQHLLLPKLSSETVKRFEQMRIDYHQVLSENLKENFSLTGIADYRIRPGDSLWELSRNKGFPLWLIYRLNPELRFSGLAQGEVIKLPELKRI